MSARRRIGVVVAMLGLAGALSGTGATAQPAFFDWCDGVDHPPFDRDYPGDGFSFLLYGFAFEPNDDGTFPTGTVEVTGGGIEEQAALEPDALGKAIATIGIFEFGEYQWQASIDGQPAASGTTTVTADDEPCDESTIAGAPAPSQEPTETQEPTEEPTETASPSPSPSATEAGTETGEDSGFPWGLIFLGGLILFVVGWFLARAKEDCPEETEALARAQKACDEARAKAKAAREEAEKQQAEADEVKARLDAIRETFPDAGKPGGDGWIESEGTRITSSDVRMKRAAMKAAWEHYQDNPNPQSAQETMDAWEQFDTPEFRERLRELDEHAKDLVKDLEKEQGEADAADQRADRAEADADAACKRAEEARKALADCLKKKQAPPTPAPTPEPTGGGESGPTGPDGGPSTTAGGDEEGGGCEEGAEEERNVHVHRLSIPIGIKSNVTGCEAHKSAEEARVTASDLQQIGAALGWVSTAMTLGEGGVMTLRNGAWEGVKAGANTAVNQATGIPLPTNPIQAGIDTLSVTATLTGRLLAAFAGLHERRLNDCDLGIAQTYDGFVVRCAEVFRCQGGEWVSAGKTVTITRTRSYSTGYKKYSAITWPRVQELLNAAGRRQAGRMRAKLQELDRIVRECA